MIRFQADADLNRLIVRACLRLEPAMDFQTAAEANLRGVKDPEVLALSADEGRILVSHDKKTMPSHFGDFIAKRTSPGVIIVPQYMSVAEAAEGLVLVWSASEASEWTNRIFWLRF